MFQLLRLGGILWFLKSIMKALYTMGRCACGNQAFLRNFENRQQADLDNKNRSKILSSFQGFIDEPDVPHILQDVESHVGVML